MGQGTFDCRVIVGFRHDTQIGQLVLNLASPVGWRPNNGFRVFLRLVLDIIVVASDDGTSHGLCSTRDVVCCYETYMKDSANSFPPLTARYVNEVRYDPDFAPTSVVALYRLRSGSQFREPRWRRLRAPVVDGSRCWNPFCRVMSDHVHRQIWKLQLLFQVERPMNILVHLCSCANNWRDQQESQEHNVQASLL